VHYCSPLQNNVTVNDSSSTTTHKKHCFYFWNCYFEHQSQPYAKQHHYDPCNNPVWNQEILTSFTVQFFTNINIVTLLYCKLKNAMWQLTEHFKLWCSKTFLGQQLHKEVEWQINILRPASVLDIRDLVYSPFNQLAQLLAQESYIEFSHHISFRSFIKSMIFGYKNIIYVQIFKYFTETCRKLNHSVTYVCNVYIR